MNTRKRGWGWLVPTLQLGVPAGGDKLSPPPMLESALTVERKELTCRRDKACPWKEIRQIFGGGQWRGRSSHVARSRKPKSKAQWTRAKQESGKLRRRAASDTGSMARQVSFWPSGRQAISGSSTFVVGIPPGRQGAESAKHDSPGQRPGIRGPTNPSPERAAQSQPHT